MHRRDMCIKALLEYLKGSNHWREKGLDGSLSVIRILEKHCCGCQMDASTSRQVLLLGFSKHDNRYLSSLKAKNTFTSCVRISTTQKLIYSMANYIINKPTGCTFCMYLLYNFCANLHALKDHFVHHQEFMIAPCRTLTDK